MIPDLNIGPVSLVAGIASYRAVLLFVASAGLGALGAWGITAIPFRERLLDLPNERSSHTDPTPRGGGVGILAAFMLAGLTLRIPTIFLFSGLLISSVSLYGDFFRISVRSRLFFQVVASLMILFPLLPRLGSHYLPQAGSLPLPLALILLVLLLFIVGTANFFNFMDGINGIAGLTGAVGFGLLGLHALNRGPQDALQAPFAFLAFCIALACLGYLPFNLPRAKVFMGDVGSILLG
ncbi:MAG: hypothetical protein FWE89_04470, partial [Syntrophaceae bacterium]|nr:hypothetical protein [Syntrophaceae bacterium]